MQTYLPVIHRTEKSNLVFIDMPSLDQAKDHFISMVNGFAYRLITNYAKTIRILMTINHLSIKTENGKQIKDIASVIFQSFRGEDAALISSI